MFFSARLYCMCRALPSIQFTHGTHSSWWKICSFLAGKLVNWPFHLQIYQTLPQIQFTGRDDQAWVLEVMTKVGVRKQGKPPHITTEISATGRETRNRSEQDDSSATISEVTRKAGSLTKCRSAIKHHLSGCGNSPKGTPAVAPRSCQSASDPWKNEEKTVWRACDFSRPRFIHTPGFLHLRDEWQRMFYIPADPSQSGRGNEFWSIPR